MKVLVACELPDDALEQLRSLAVDLDVRPQVAPAELRAALTGVGVLIVGGTRVSPESLAGAASLQMIVHAGSGPGNIALEDASSQGIFVAHCPDTHATAVAELAIGLLLGLDRRIVDNTIALREGRWIRGELGDARGLAGRTLGLLGYDAVGRLVAARARAFGMRVVGWSPRWPDIHAEPDFEGCNWPREVARLADAVVVTPVGHPSELLVDAEFLDSMKPGALLIHVGHPGAVDEPALLRAVEQQHVRAALDVHSTEPATESARYRCRLCEMPGVIGTQHIGPLTAQARRATADEVIRVVRAFVVSGEVLNCLNITDRSPATWQLVLRVRDQVGVMAAILDAVRADGINAQEITSRVFTGAKAAWCTIALDERPSAEALASIRALPDVLHLELRAVV